MAEPGARIVIVHVHEVDRSEGNAVHDRIESVSAAPQAAGFAVVVVTPHALPHTVSHAMAEVAREVGAG